MRHEHLRKGQVVAVKVAEIAGEINNHPPFVTTGEVIGPVRDELWWVMVNTPAGPMEQMYQAEEIVGLWWKSAMST